MPAQAQADQASITQSADKVATDLNQAGDKTAFAQALSEAVGLHSQLNQADWQAATSELSQNVDLKQLNLDGFHLTNIDNSNPQNPLIDLSNGQVNVAVGSRGDVYDTQTGQVLQASTLPDGSASTADGATVQQPLDTTTGTVPAGGNAQTDGTAAATPDVSALANIPLSPVDISLASPPASPTDASTAANPPASPTDASTAASPPASPTDASTAASPPASPTDASTAASPPASPTDASTAASPPASPTDASTAASPPASPTDAPSATQPASDQPVMGPSVNADGSFGTNGRKMQLSSDGTQGTYTVQPGDNLWSIAEDSLAESASGESVAALVQQLAADSNIQDPSLIYPGQQITFNNLGKASDAALQTTDQSGAVPPGTQPSDQSGAVPPGTQPSDQSGAVPPATQPSDQGQSGLAPPQALDQAALAPQNGVYNALNPLGLSDGAPDTSIGTPTGNLIGRVASKGYTDDQNVTTREITGTLNDGAKTMFTAEEQTDSNQQLLQRDIQYTQPVSMTFDNGNGGQIQVNNIQDIHTVSNNGSYISTITTSDGTTYESVAASDGTVRQTAMTGANAVSPEDTTNQVGTVAPTDTSGPAIQAPPESYASMPANPTNPNFTSPTNSADQSNPTYNGPGDSTNPSNPNYISTDTKF